MLSIEPLYNHIFEKARGDFSVKRKANRHKYNGIIGKRVIIYETGPKDGMRISEL